MRVIRVEKPFQRFGCSTGWTERTPRSRVNAQRIVAGGLFGLAVTATVTISARSPLLAWGYCLGIFLLCLGGLVGSLRESHARISWSRNRTRYSIPAGALVLLSLWGFGQLALGATEYREGTWNESLRMAALGGTTYAAAFSLASADLRLRFLRGFAWFGFMLSAISFAAYFTSPGKVLWLFPSPYPDVWGPFLSRNDFAGFLELSFPVALWMSLDGSVHRARMSGARMPLWVPAWMLAAGVASGSRAGAALLLVEAAVVLVASAPKRIRFRFMLLAVLLVALTGAGALLGRLSDRDPLRYRREIASSTLQMIAERPWRGFGIGTYAQVYPAYAQFDSGTAVEHAHNHWLEWAAEGGIPYALVWGALACGIFLPAARSIWGLGTSVAFLHALVDYPYARFGLTAWNFALIGALLVIELREVGGPPHLHSSRNLEENDA